MATVAVSSAPGTGSMQIVVIMMIVCCIRIPSSQMMVVLIVVPGTCWTTVRSTNRTGRRWERTLLILFRY